MNWKNKLSKPFAVGDTVTEGEHNYEVVDMSCGTVAVQDKDGETFTGTEKEYFKILVKVIK